MSRPISRWHALRATTADGIDRYRALLHSPLHRTLIGASALSDIGDWLNLVALTVLAYQFGDGVFAVGLMLALRKLPGLLFQLPAGALIDRVQGPGVLIASQLLLAAIAGSLALLLIFPQLWLLYLLVFLLETVNVVTFPAFRAAVARWTDTDHRGTATALLNLEDTLAWMIGPVLGGLVLMVSSAEVLFLVNALSYVVAASAVWWVWQHRDTFKIGTSEDSEAVSSDGAGFAAYRSMLCRTDLIGYATMTMFGALIMQGAMVIFVLRAIDLGFGEEDLGIFHAALALGCLFGGIVAGLGKYLSGSVLLLVAVTEVVNAAGFALFAVLPQPWLVLLVLIIVGSTSELAETPALTYFQNTMLEEQFGRMFSALLFAGRTGGLMGLLLVPWLGLRLGEERALFVLALAGIAFATGFGIWARQWLREETLTDRPLVSEQPTQEVA